MYIFENVGHTKVVKIMKYWTNIEGDTKDISLSLHMLTVFDAQNNDHSNGRGTLLEVINRETIANSAPVLYLRW